MADTITQLYARLRPLIQRDNARGGSTIIYQNGSSGGGSGGGSGVTDHGALTGLADDDHPQYLTQARGSTFFIAASRLLTAGDGLTGGGDLSADRTFAVDSSVVRTSATITPGAGLVGATPLVLSAPITLNVASANEGIVVNTNDIALTLKAASGLSIGTGGLSIGTPSTIVPLGSNTVTGATHVHAADSSADPTTTLPALKLLHSTDTGGLTLGNLQVKGNVDITNGGDFTVGANVFFVDASQANVGIGGAPDPQFTLDVNGPLRAQYFIGPHAIQLKDVFLLAHFDGMEAGTLGELNGHMGQIGLWSGGTTRKPIHVTGKFGKGLNIGAYSQNYVSNPSFDDNITGWTMFMGGGGTGGAIVYDSTRYHDGGASIRITPSNAVNQTSLAQNTTTTLPASAAGSGGVITAQCWVYRADATGALLSIQRINNGGGYVATVSASAASLGAWEWLTVSYTVSATDVSNNASFHVGLHNNNSAAAGQAFAWFDSVQLEVGPVATPFMIGQRGYVSSGNRYDFLQYATNNNIDARHGTIMMWILTYGFFNNGFWRFLFSAADTNAWFDLGLEPSGSLVFRNGGSTRITSVFSTNEKKWTHIALTWDVNIGCNLYINGQQAGTVNATYAPFWPYPYLNLGALIQNTSAYPPNITFDDFVITKTAMSKDAIRAVYESDAPVFAETSIFSFRATPLGLVWADEEGLWMRSTTGNAVLGVYGGAAATKSWGGHTLEAGDFALGRKPGHYLWWDDSNGLLTVSGAITILSGSSGLANLSDAGALATANNLDDVADGANYKRTNATQVTGAQRASVALDANNRLITTVKGGGTVTSAPPAGVGLYLGSDYLGYYNGSAWRTYMDSSGNFYLGGTAGALTWNGSTLAVTGTITANAGSFAGFVTIGTSGGIYQGTGTAASPTTGLKIYNKSGVGVIEGFNAGTFQAGFGTDGKFRAGTSHVFDTAGISVTAVHNGGNEFGMQFFLGAERNGSLWYQSVDSGSDQYSVVYLSSGGTSGMHEFCRTVARSQRTGAGMTAEAYIAAHDSTAGYLTGAYVVAKEGASNGKTVTIYAPDGATVSGALSVTGGLNMLSGADVRVGGPLVLGGYGDNNGRIRPYGAFVVASGATAVLNSAGINGFLFIICTSEPSTAMFACRSNGAPVEIADPQGVYSAVAGTATSHNIYLAGGTSGALTIQNNRGANRTYHVIMLGASNDF